MDDFLWNCAMEASEDSRFDIIPDFQDDMRQFGSEKDGNAQPDQVFILQPDSSSGDIAVQIIESRDYGVLDIIGGELWEGALLLCAYILMHKENFLGHDVLELGSGVGLPGLLLAALKARRADSQVASSVILSDNDPRVVRNLGTAITSQFPLASHHGMNRTGTEIITKQLDWSIFTPVSNDNNTIPSTESMSEAAQLVLEDTRDRSAVIMGCELCYAPYHARCLAELLR
jgi:predicted nicotinamide N-methyase